MPLSKDDRPYAVLSLFVLMAIFMAPVAAGQALITTFDTDLEGWSCTNGINGTPVQRSSGGNPGGYLYINNEDQSDRRVVVCSAPSKFKGNLLPYLGGKVSFDGNLLVKSGRYWEDAESATLGGNYGTMRISGAGGTVTKDIVPGFPGEKTWQTYSYPLTAQAWGVSDSQWSAILANVSSIELNLEAVFGEEENGMDNFQMVPLATTGDEVLDVQPVSLSFSGYSNGGFSDKYVEVGAKALGRPFTASVTGPEAAWMKVFSPGQTPGQVRVRVDPTRLASGRYTGTVTISAPGATPNTLTIPVTYNVGAARQPTLYASPSSLSMFTGSGVVTPTGVTGPNQGYEYITLKNVGSGTLGPLRASIVNSPGLVLKADFIPSPCSLGGTAQSSCLLGVLGTGSTQDTQTGGIIIQDNNGVALRGIQVTQQPRPQYFSIFPRQYFVGAFANPPQGPVPPRVPLLQTLTVLNPSGVPTPFVANATVPWLTVTPATGEVGTQITAEVKADATGLPPGGYYGSVIVTALTSSGPRWYSEIVQVVMEVVPSTGAVRSSLPQGSNRVLIAGSSESLGFNARDLDDVERPITIVDNYQGGPAFFQHSSKAVGSLKNPPNIQVTLSKPSPPPGVYSGTLVVRVGNKSPQMIPIVAIVPPVGGSTFDPVSRGAAATCVPTRIVPVIASPSQNFDVLTAWPTELDIAVVDDCGLFNNTGSVQVSFSNDDSPQFLVPLDGGRWSGVWTGQTPSDNVIVTVTATSKDGKLQESTTIGGVLEVNPAPVPFLFDGGIVNGASFALGGPLAPGSFVSLFGTALADKQLSAPSVPLPNTLAGASVQIGGKDAPVFFASDGQLNAIVPYGLPVDTSLSVVAKRGDAVAVLRAVPFAAAAPGVFTYGDQQGIVVGVAANGSQTLVDATHPLTAGQVIVLYCTGLGEVNPAVAAGSPTPGTQLSRTVNTVTMTIGGVPAKVDFAGLTPGQTGLYQINATVPAGVTLGDRVALVVSEAGQSSAPSFIAVR